MITNSGDIYSNNIINNDTLKTQKIEVSSNIIIKDDTNGTGLRLNATTLGIETTHNNGNSWEQIGKNYYIENTSTTPHTFTKGGEIFNDYNNNQASGTFSHAEGNNCQATGVRSHAEGYQTIAGGTQSHAEGYKSSTTGFASHAEGESTRTEGGRSHTEGFRTKTTGENAHAEGGSTIFYIKKTTDQIFNYIIQYENTEYLVSPENFILNGYIDLNNYNIPTDRWLKIEDLSNLTSGQNSHIEGGFTYTNAESAHVEGKGGILIENIGTTQNPIYKCTLIRNEATGNASHVEGIFNHSSGIASHAEGYNTTASGENAHSGGLGTIASQKNQTVIGQYNINDTGSTTNKLFVIGNGADNNNRNDAFIVDTTGNTIINGLISSINGNNGIRLNPTTNKIQTTTNGGNLWIDFTGGGSDVGQFYYDTTTGDLKGEIFNDYINNKASGNYSHTEGSHSGTSNINNVNYNKGSYGNYSHCEGYNNISYGNYSHAEGNLTNAIGESSHTEGISTTATGNYSHVEGHKNGNDYITYNNINYTKGSYGNYSHCECSNCSATGEASHAEGGSCIAIGARSHAEGINTKAVGTDSHAEGNNNISNGPSSHVEGRNNIAGGDQAHAEGSSGSCNGNQTHSEGFGCHANAHFAHAEGYNSTASGKTSHAQASGTLASGENAHSGGLGTIASQKNQTVIGQYNINDTGSTTNKLFVIGNGTDNNNRSDAFIVDTSGNTTISGNLILGNFTISVSGNTLTIQ